MASCDGQLHLWDLETNTTLGMYDFGKQGASRIVSVGGQHVIAAATLDGRLAFVDPRAGRIVREWQSSLPTLAQKEAGGAPPEKRTVQAMTCDADGRAIITGTASGRIVALDARTGVLESAWIAHEGEVTGLLALSSERVVSGSSNGQLALLDTPSRTAATRCKLAHHDPVLSFDMIGKDLVALQASNRLSVFGQLERQPPTAAGAAHRLRHLRGANATVLRAFPLNQWLLVGSESGPLSLFA